MDSPVSFINLPLVVGKRNSCRVLLTDKWKYPGSSNTSVHFITWAVFAYFLNHREVEVTLGIPLLVVQLEGHRFPWQGSLHIAFLKGLWEFLKYLTEPRIFLFYQYTRESFLHVHHLDPARN